MKKIPLLIILLVVAAFSNSSSAGIIFVPVGGLTVLDGASLSQVEKTINDDTVTIKIKTQGLSVVDNLQGFTATDDLWLIITFPKNASTTAIPVAAGIVEGRVKGRWHGRIEGLLEQPLNLKARIKGEAYCIGQGENPCTALAVVLDLKGVLLFAPLKPAEFAVDHAGFADIKVMATFFAGDNAEPPAWKEWAYSGEIGLLEATAQ